MTKSNRLPIRKLLVTIVALALFATACGGSGGASSEQAIAAIAEAATNETQLVLTDTVDSTQFLDTADGSVRQLSDVVTGDRPVLLWYWAPN